MEIVSVKFQEDILKKMDKAIEQHNFNSRTEFIREAVRDKMVEIDRGELIKQFLSLRGKGKPKSGLSDEEIREQVSKELLEELDKRFS